LLVDVTKSVAQRNVTGAMLAKLSGMYMLGIWKLCAAVLVQ
jgi:hypothetical protein